MIRNHTRVRNGSNKNPVWLMAGVLIVSTCSIALGGGRGPRSRAPSKKYEAGRALFLKVWEPDKPSPAGGDGLGPLYNEASCVACHRLGGVGGGGLNEQNVNLVTAVTKPTPTEVSRSAFIGELPELHEGFRAASSIVVHRNAMNPSDEKRLVDIASFTGVRTSDRNYGLRKSTRNTPAVFGDGLIDAIPDRVLFEAEKKTFVAFPDVKGRVSRLPDGRVGRFGWKAQTPSLREFALAACANELGLEVPGHHQAQVHRTEDTGRVEERLDMTREECDELVDYLARIPPPVLRPVYVDVSEPLGYRVFEQVGCATCHTPRLGDVNGLYSDLLLHDMGASLADAATYYGGSTSPADVGNLADARDRARATGGGAVMSEWRTPPLWGVADSAPYLHDGRAATLDVAIRLHGGEASKIAERYANLDRGDRRLLLQFLHSLTVVQPRSRRTAAIEAIQARARRTDTPPE